MLTIMHAKIPLHQRETYEGWLMIISALLVSWLVLSLSFRSVSLRQSIEHSLRTSLETSSAVGVFVLTFSAVAREGAELSMFLQALLIDTANNHTAVIACLGGISAGIALAYVMIRWLAHVRLRWLMQISGIILLLMAGELMIEGIEKLGIL
jgi:high-affinity iron transporter